MKLKTLKDIDEDKLFDKGNGIVSVDKLRRETIKWIKEDFGVLGMVEPEMIVRKWMKRLNITEKDLK